MKIKEINSIANEMNFIKRVRLILGTNNHPLPIFEPIKKMPKGDEFTLGMCEPSSDPNLSGTNYILFLNDITKSKSLFQKVLAHELCHDAEFQLVWFPKFKKKLMQKQKNYKKIIKKLDDEMIKKSFLHGKNWKQLANKINAVYGKNFVVAEPFPTDSEMDEVFGKIE